MKKSTKDYHNRIKKGLCGWCSKPLEGMKALCKPCNKKSLYAIKERHKKYRKNGECVNGCGNPTMPKSPYCEKHQFYHRMGMRDLSATEKEKAWTAWLIFKENPSCDICGSTDPLSSHGWMVDHNHKTKKFRGFLCQGCNLGLGGFRDDQIFLFLAINYLKKEEYEYSSRSTRTNKTIEFKTKTGTSIFKN